MGFLICYSFCSGGFGAGGGTEVYICFAYLSHCFLFCFTYMLLQFNDF